MKCPNCGYEVSKVTDSRPTDDGSIRRRRECLGCHKRFTTYEIVDFAPITVVKKDGSREYFDRNKIRAGMIKACYKRPVTPEQIDDEVTEIENELKSSLDLERNSQEIGTMVMDKLRGLDEVSYVRFASVYREFKDVETFMEELKRLRKD